jgi:hypothetical protein
MLPDVAFAYALAGCFLIVMIAHYVNLYRDSAKQQERRSGRSGALNGVPERTLNDAERLSIAVNVVEAGVGVARAIEICWPGVKRGAGKRYKELEAQLRERIPEPDPERLGQPKRRVHRVRINRSGKVYYKPLYDAE